MAVTGDPEPAETAQTISAKRDAYTAGRDIVFNVTVSSQDQDRREGTDQPDQPDRPGDREPDAPGLGERLFTAHVGEHSGKLSVAFGADDTLVVTDQDAVIHRWSLSGRTELPGASVSGSAPLLDSVMHDVRAKVAVSTVIPAVAVARGSRCSVVRFSDSGFSTSSFSLAWTEVLVSASAARFVTFDGRRIAVRDFADGKKVLWELPSPPGMATVAIDARGTTVAMVSARNWLTAANTCTVASQEDARPHEFTVTNLPVAGAQLGLAPGGALAVCATLREIVLARPGTGEIVRRRRTGSPREEILPALGARPQRLVCMASGQVLWLRGRRVVDVNWTAGKFRYLPQDGLCDDIDFDHANSRLAMVSESGQVDVFQWRETG